MQTQSSLIPPPIETDDDFRLALDAVTPDMTYDMLPPEQRVLVDSADAYRTRTLFDSRRDPIADNALKQQMAGIDRAADLYRDIKTNKEARQRLVNWKGEDWVRRFESLPDEERLGDATYIMLDEAFDGANPDNLAMLRYIRQFNLPDSHANWQQIADHFRGLVRQSDDYQKQQVARIDKLKQLIPDMTLRMLNGENLITILEGTEGLDADDWLMLLDGYGIGTDEYKSIRIASEAIRQPGELDVNRMTELYLRDPVANGYAWSYLMHKSDELRNDKIPFFSNMFGSIGKGLLSAFAAGDKARDVVGNFDRYIEQAIKGIGRGEFGQNTPPPLTPEQQAEAVRRQIESVTITHPDGRKEIKINPFNWPRPLGDYEDDVRHEAAVKEGNPDAIRLEQHNRYQAVIESPFNPRDSAGWLEQRLDSVGTMAGQTAMFLLTRGVATGAAIGNDRYEQLRMEGSSVASSILRGAVAGGTEVFVERFSFGKLKRPFGSVVTAGKKHLPWLQKIDSLTLGNMPGFTRLTGYAMGARAAAKNGLYGSAALRYSTMVGMGTFGEMIEEFASPSLQAPIDAGIAYLFGEDNGMTAVEWKEQISSVASWDTLFEMGVLSAGLSMASYPSLMADARLVSMKADAWRAMGLTEKDAVNVSNIVDPVTRMEEGRRLVKESAANKEALERASTGIKSMNEDYSWLADMEAYQAEVELGNLPTATVNEDGTWNVNLGSEQGAVTMTDQQATAYLNAKLTQEVRDRITLAQNNLVVNATIDTLKTSGRFEFESMTAPETLASINAMATAAKLRVSELTEQGVANPSEQIDPSLSSHLTLQQLQDADAAMQSRVQLAIERGEVDPGNPAPIQSYAYRTPIGRDKTLIRFVEGQTRYDQLIEEVVEDNFIRTNIAEKRTPEWWTDTLRATDRELSAALGRDVNLVKKTEGALSEDEVLECISDLVKADFFARYREFSLPSFIRDFLDMITRWVTQGQWLAELGNGLKTLQKQGKLDKTLAHTINTLAGQTAEQIASATLQRTTVRTAEAVSTAVAEAASESLSELGIRTDVAVPPATTPEVSVEPSERLKSTSDANPEMVSQINEREQGINPKAPSATIARLVRDQGYTDTDAAKLGLTEGRPLMAFRIGAFASPELYKLYDTGKIAIQKAAAIAYASQRPDIQKVGINEASKPIRDIVNTMQAAAAQSGKFNIKQARKTARYASLMQQKLERQIARLQSPAGTARGNVDALTSRIVSLQSQLETWRNFAAFPNLLKRASQWDGKSAVSPESSIGSTFSITQDQYDDARLRLSGWLSMDNILIADGKTRQEILKIFPSERKPIAYIPTRLLPLLDENLSDGAVYSGMAYFLDHVVNHHSELTVDQYRFLPDVLSDPDEIILDDRRKAKAFIFLKKIDKNLTEAFELAENEGKLNLVHLTFYKSSKAPSKKLKRIYKKEKPSVDAHSTIRRDSEKSPGRGRFSALGDNTAIADGGNDVNTTMSLTQGEPWQLISLSDNKPHMAFVNTITKQLKQDIALWRRYEGMPQSEREEMLVTMASSLSLAKTVAAYMPVGYRIGMKPYLDWLQIFAEMATTGDIAMTESLTSSLFADKLQGTLGRLALGLSQDDAIAAIKQYGVERADQLMAKLLTRVSDQLAKYGRDTALKNIAHLISSVQPAKGKGKSKRGRMNADAYRKLKKITGIMSMSAADLNTKLDELKARLVGMSMSVNDNEGIDTEVIDALTLEITDYQTYGAIKDMTLDQLTAAGNALEKFIKSEKSDWSAALEAMRSQRRDVAWHIANGLQQSGKKVTPNSLAEANVKTSADAIINAGDALESMPQFLARLEHVPGLKVWANHTRLKLADAAAGAKRALKLRTIQQGRVQERAAALAGKTPEQWMSGFKEIVQTDISLGATKAARLNTTIDNARKWIDATPEQRDAMRYESPANKTNIDEDAIAPLRQALELYDTRDARYRADLEAWENLPAKEKKATPKPRKPRPRKNISIDYAKQLEKTEPLRLSRDAALYIILLHEQQHYTQMMIDQGYTDAVIDKLRQFVGPDGLEYGYGLRELIAQQGKVIASIYENIYGTPFPQIENYFAARFVANDKINDLELADMLAGISPLFGGGLGFLESRTAHNRAIDISRTATGVFEEATGVSDNWIYTHELVSDLRSLLTNRLSADAMKVNLGNYDYQRLKAWCGLIERAGISEGKTLGAADYIGNLLYSAGARAILSYRVETIIKQASAVLNAWANDPTIFLTDWLTTLMKMRNRSAPMTITRMLKSDIMQDRRMGKSAITRELINLDDNQIFTWMDKVVNKGMGAIEDADVFFNAVGMTSLWNIYYTRGIKSGMTPAQAEQQADNSVKLALPEAAQPQIYMEKSYGSLKINILGRALFFMMSEQFNKVGLIYSLMRRPGWQSKVKGLEVWLAYGTLNALIGAVLDLMRDDDEARRKRSLSGYIYAALTGPLAGVPVIGEGIEYLFRQFLGVKVYTGSAGRGIVDVEGGGRAVINLYKMMDRGGYGFPDYLRECLKLSRLTGVASGLTPRYIGSTLLLASVAANPIRTALNLSDATGLTEKKKVK